jgi:hypothetical protein
MFKVCNGKKKAANPGGQGLAAFCLSLFVTTGALGGAGTFLLMAPLA